MSIEDFGHKVGTKYDELYHSETGLKGAIRRNPLTFFWACAGAGALLGFVAGVFV